MPCSQTILELGMGEGRDWYRCIIYHWAHTVLYSLYSQYSVMCLNQPLHMATRTFFGQDWEKHKSININSRGNLTTWPFSKAACVRFLFGPMTSPVLRLGWWVQHQLWTPSCESGCNFSGQDDWLLPRMILLALKQWEHLAWQVSIIASKDQLCKTTDAFSPPAACIAPFSNTKVTN